MKLALGCQGPGPELNDLRNQSQLLSYTHRKSLQSLLAAVTLSLHLSSGSSVCPDQTHEEILVFCLLRSLQQPWPWIPAMKALPLGYTPSAQDVVLCAQSCLGMAVILEK